MTSVQPTGPHEHCADDGHQSKHIEHSGTEQMGVCRRRRRQIRTFLRNSTFPQGAVKSGKLQREAAVRSPQTIAHRQSDLASFVGLGGATSRRFPTNVHASYLPNFHPFHHNRNERTTAVMQPLRALMLGRWHVTAASTRAIIR